MRFKPIASIVLSLLAAVAVASVGVPATCYVCIGAYRPQRPSNVIPANVGQCIRLASVGCPTCPAETIAALCSTPVYPCDIPWYIRPFI